MYVSIARCDFEAIKLANRDAKIDFAQAQSELATAIAQLAAIEKLRQKR